MSRRLLDSVASKESSSLLGSTRFVRSSRLSKVFVSRAMSDVIFASNLRVVSRALSWFSTANSSFSSRRRMSLMDSLMLLSVSEKSLELLIELVVGIELRPEV